MRGQKCVSSVDGNNNWNAVTSKIKERKVEFQRM